MSLLFLLSANFIFYIAFVQFGLLKVIEGRFGLSMEALILPLASMAITGAISSVTVGYIIDRSRSTLRKIYYIACFLSILEGIAAIYSIALFDTSLLVPLFIALGLLMGINGVLVIRLVEAWPEARRGLMAGCAMAAVYLISNLLAGFVPMPERVALICGIVAVITGVLCLPYPLQNPLSPYPKGHKPFAKGGLSYLKVIVILATLIAVDSFLFYTETNREELYRYTWDGRWLLSGIVHSITAIFAGVLWDKRGSNPVLLICLSTFMIALLILILFPLGHLTGLVSTLFYNTAVSFYGILMLIIWFCVDSKIGTGFKIGAGMAVVGWVASPAGIAVAMKSMSVPIPALFSGPLILIMFLFLIRRF